jgi:hypothetical protein
VWGDVVDSQTTFVMEARLKVISAGAALDSGVTINANAAGRTWALHVADGNVGFGGNTIVMPTTDVFHVYRIEAGVVTADLFIDSVEVLSDVPHGGGSSITHFGDSRNGTAGVTPTLSEWDYFTITTDTATPGNALTWTLNNVVFADGATATGSFVYDANINEYSAVNVTVSGGGGLEWMNDPFTYIDTSGGVPSPLKISSFDYFQVPDPTYPCETGTSSFCQRGLRLDFAAPLTGSGGDISLVITSTAREFLDSGGYPPPDPYVRYVASGQVSAPLATIPVSVRVNNDNPVHAHHVGPTPHDVLPIDVFGEASFDVTDIDASSVVAGPNMASDRDAIAQIGFVDGDGFEDATFDFWMGDTGISCSDIDVTLSGEITGGQPFEGAGSITTDCNASCH